MLASFMVFRAIRMQQAQTRDSKSLDSMQLQLRHELLAERHWVAISPESHATRHSIEQHSGQIWLASSMRALPAANNGFYLMEALYCIRQTKLSSFNK